MKESAKGRFFENLSPPPEDMNLIGQACRLSLHLLEITGLLADFVSLTLYDLRTSETKRMFSSYCLSPSKGLGYKVWRPVIRKCLFLKLSLIKYFKLTEKAPGILVQELVSTSLRYHIKKTKDHTKKNKYHTKKTNFLT